MWDKPNMRYLVFECNKLHVLIIFWIIFSIRYENSNLCCPFFNGIKLIVFFVFCS